MLVRLAAFAAWLTVCWAALPAAAADRLTLDGAFARVADTHPDLRLFGSRRDALTAELDRAAFRPPLAAGAEVENFGGTGDSSGLGGAEVTLTLASVFERGGKLDARRTLAQSRIDALAFEREIKRIDLLAEVARRYLAIVSAERQREIAQLDITQRTVTVSQARRRLEAGASPESVVLTAQAALAKAELGRDRAGQRLIAARQHLAALWGERSPTFEVAAANPLALPQVADFAQLADLLQRTPELAQFTSEQRIREARVQLARTARAPDVDWQVGVRRTEDTNDTGFVARLSMPLGMSSRAQPEIRQAEAELTSLEIEREAAGLALYSTLAEAHGRFVSARLEVQRLQSDVLPKLARAESAAEVAYHSGAISYLEWAQLQSERTNSRMQQLDAALEAQRALIEIQRLTGESFVTAAPEALLGDSP